MIRTTYKYEMIYDTCVHLSSFFQFILCHNFLKFLQFSLVFILQFLFIEFLNTFL